MPRAAVDKNQLFTFVNGLNTEASGLTFPENSVVDADNIRIDRDGSANRRLGLDYEDSYVLSTETVSSINLASVGVSFHDWPAVNNNGNINFFVIQVGNELWVYNKDASPISNGYLTTVDISAYNITAFAPGKVLVTLRVDMDSSVQNGHLFMTAIGSEPLVLEYDDINEELLVSTLELQIRDFDGVDDDLEVDERPATLSAAHEYNLMNQGWIETKDSGVNAGPQNPQRGPSSTTSRSYVLRQTITGVSL